jgi:exosortase C (VPDSG-CTERM-specific)
MISNSLDAAWGHLPRSQRLRIAGALGFVTLATLLFGEPLVGLFRHALGNNLHSHIPLVPLISAYLLYVRPQPALTRYRRSVVGAVALGAVGAAAVAAGVLAGERLSVNDYLATMTLAYVCVIAAGGFLFLGSEWMAAAAFPMAFLLFMIPLPDAAVSWLEMASARASADVSEWLFVITGTPLLRDGMFFALPGIVIEVARECSGIRSSWVLFITSVLASYLFLANGWRRVALVAFVIPLGIVRNALRILTLGLLSVHVGPHIIDGPIHRRGGPVFFVLSLIPLFVVMWWLWRQERRGRLRG